MRRSWEIDRRTFLRGAGTSIGLPMLEAMLPGLRSASAAGIATPKRLVFYFFCNGIADTGILSTGSGFSGNREEGRAGTFWPRTLGSDFELTHNLQPLADLKDDILVIRDLANMMAEHPLPDGLGHGAAQTLLTGAEPGLSDDKQYVVRAAPSVDQVAAAALKKYTPALPSLFLGHPIGRDNESYWGVWSGPTTKVYPHTQPSQGFKQVFGDNTVDLATRQKRVAYRKNVLDHVKTDVGRIQRKLGRADRETLEKYLANVLDLEERISASSTMGADTCTTKAAAPEDTKVTPFATIPEYPDYYTGAIFDLPAHMKKMSDLVTLAFQCDITRVVTMQVSNHDLDFGSWLGAPHDKLRGDWHGYATHAASPNADAALREAGLDLYRDGSRAHFAMFGELVRKLKNTPEIAGGSQSILDNTILVCTSDMSYGNGHNMRHLPVIVAGGRNLGVRTGRFIAAPPPEQPIYNLWVSMLNAVGVEVSSFGASTGAQPLT